MSMSNPLGAPVSHREVVWLPGGANAHHPWSRHRRRALFYFNKNNLKSDGVIDIELILKNEGNEDADVRILKSSTDIDPLGDPWEYDHNDEFLDTFENADDPVTLVPEGMKVTKFALEAGVKYLMLQLNPEAEEPGGNVRAQVVSSNEKQLL